MESTSSLQKAFTDYNGFKNGFESGKTWKSKIGNPKDPPFKYDL